MCSSSSAALLLAATALLAPQAADAETIQITIQNLVFSPAEVTAKVGDNIEWVNKDVFVHTATARDGAFDVNIAANKTAKLVVQKAGDIEYYCRFHPIMTAKLKVGGGS
jgi:plastocyanin